MEPNNNNNNTKTPASPQGRSSAVSDAREAIARSRARRSSRMSQASASQQPPLEPSAAPPTATATATSQQQQQQQLQQAEQDARIKQRARRSARTSQQTVVPGAQAVAVEPSAVASTSAVVSQREADVTAKARARNTVTVNQNLDTIVPGAVSVKPSPMDHAPPLSPTTTRGNTTSQQMEEDLRLKARGGRVNRASLQRNEQDAMAKLRSSRTRETHTPPVSTMTASVPFPAEDGTATGAGGLEELARRREDRANARAERRGAREHSASSVQETTNGHDEAVTNGNNASDQTNAPNPADNIHSTTEEERQLLYDTKMAMMDQQHQDSQEKRNIDGKQHQLQLQQLQLDEGPKHGGTFIEQGGNATRSNVPATQPITTALRGMAAPPDVEYGEYNQPRVRDDELAVAIPIDHEEEEEEKNIVLAVEYDPDSKPPLYQNRRFRLYGLVCVTLSVLLAVMAAVSISKNKDSQPSFLVANPTAAPTITPTTSRESTYRSFFAAQVSPLVLQEGTPHYRAAEWIMNEDPMQLPPDSQNLLQRYMMAFIYFHSTSNGETQWRSCNPPQEGEDDTCIFLDFTRDDDDVITYTPRYDRVRWLSGQGECSWVGVECAGGSSVLGFRLIGQQLKGTLPTELTALPLLQRISVPYNEITGTLPPEYASLRYLLDIEVHGNLLTGTIPSEYFEDSISLVNFNIGDNALSGTLDTRIGLMTDLKGLHIFENNLEGNFPTEIGNLNYLSFTRINGNQFDGPIPTQLGLLIQLSELWFHENSFTGNLPSQLGRLYRLQDFRLWGNKLTGTIPEELYSMTKLVRFSVREMALTGTLSPLVAQMTDLEQLKVSTNQLTGPIPSSIQQMTNLRLAWLHRNLFTGSVPLEICSLVPAQGTDAIGLSYLQADCQPEDNPPNPCQCCSACCERETTVCLLNDANARFL